MTIEKITGAELSGLRRMIGDPTGSSYSDADLYGYIGDAVLQLRNKYYVTQFTISGGYIAPTPSYNEQAVLDLQSKILIMQSKSFNMAIAGGISYQDPVKKIDTTSAVGSLAEALKNEESKLDSILYQMNMDGVNPIGKPTWQSPNNTVEDLSLKLNVLEN